MVDVQELDALERFVRAVERAIERGLVAVALVDRSGATRYHAGAISAEEARPLAAVVVYRLKSDDLAARLFSGDVLSLALDDRHVALGVAKRQLFVVAVLADPSQLDCVYDLRDDVARLLDVVDLAPPPWSGGAGGAGSGPAELPLVEYGITVGCERGKA
jgi:hypothetical protein